MIDSRSGSSVIGDAVPAPVAAYYAALDRERFDAAAQLLADDVLIALPPRGGHEVDPRQVAVGRDAALDMLTRRGPSRMRHEVTLCAGHDRSWYVEGVTRGPQGGRPLRTLVGHFDPS